MSKSDSMDAEKSTPNRWPLLVTVVAALLSVFQLWQTVAGFVPPGVLPWETILGMQPAVYFRPVHLCWILCLGFWVYPLRVRGTEWPWLDALTTLLVLWASWRIVRFDYSAIDHLLNGLDSADFLNQGSLPATQLCILSSSRSGFYKCLHLTFLTDHYIIQLSY